jgi:hypothetical protein
MYKRHHEVKKQHQTTLKNTTKRKTSKNRANVTSLSSSTAGSIQHDPDENHDENHDGSQRSLASRDKMWPATEENGYYLGVGTPVHKTQLDRATEFYHDGRPPPIRSMEDDPVDDLCRQSITL